MVKVRVTEGEEALVDDVGADVGEAVVGKLGRGSLLVGVDEPVTAEPQPAPLQDHNQLHLVGIMWGALSKLPLWISASGVVTSGVTSAVEGGGPLLLMGRRRLIATTTATPGLKGVGGGAVVPLPFEPSVRRATPVHVSR